MEGDLFARRGAISAAETASTNKPRRRRSWCIRLPPRRLQRAKVVHAAHAKALMQQTGVQGVGITSSVDSPGEAALMIFVIRGVTHAPIPPVIDGLRTRVRESSRFRAGYRGIEPQRVRVPASDPRDRALRRQNAIETRVNDCATLQSSPAIFAFFPGVESAHDSSAVVSSVDSFDQEAGMRRSLPVAGAFLLVCFGVSPRRADAGAGKFESIRRRRPMITKSRRKISRERIL